MPDVYIWEEVNGPVFYITVEADETVKAAGQIIVTNIQLTDNNGNYTSHYLADASAVVTAPSTLAGIIEDGIEDKPCFVTDDLTCAYVTADGMALYAKDDNGFALKDEPPYIAAAGQKLYDSRKDFDQSNWVRINLPSAVDATAYTGQLIRGIEGVLDNKTNPAITVNSLPEAVEPNPYTANWYCPANFITQDEFWFMPPKPQEYASVRWAVYKDGVFYMPVKSEVHNRNDISGAVTCKLDMYDGAVELVNNTAYELTAIVKAFNPTPEPAPQHVIGENTPKITEPSNLFEIYPITATTDDVITSVENLKTDFENGHSGRFNVLGQPVSDDYKGIVIEKGKKYIQR